MSRNGRFQHLRREFGARSFGEVSAGTVEVPPFLVEGMLLHRTVTTVAADPHSGKTMWMMTLAVACEMGLEFLGCHTRAARTLFVGQDAPTWDYVGMLQKIVRGYGLSPERAQLMESELVLNEGVQVTDGRFRKWLDEYHDEAGFDVLMLDTALDVHPFDENDNTEMSKFGKLLKGMRDRYGCSVIVAHHLAAPQLGMPRRTRGASVLRGNVDFEIVLTPLEPRTSNPRKVRMEASKARGMGAEAGGPDGFEIAQGRDGNGVSWVKLEAWHGELPHEKVAPRRYPGTRGVGRDQTEAGKKPEVAVSGDEDRVEGGGGGGVTG